eukprot:CAMPEP_0113305314 /NCGR_PEP_ID=MMETSP0010_2-20120614/4983_1 /TAXON_ID=216773 ORGANISM="Corethron hystrix, Strain 308" /NCGR_SAMPLE_ID=MMETSP0010_2 /ASSEMBLY_ACC=CAM_ASM_000155 /LENGTH=131 /DNA_ID=CAMNT_0000159693 /DNA_START=33 /DNA_END=428 /DNA_ORIENTATION=- /assembly_acc=CAM_ASM_000155
MVRIANLVVLTIIPAICSGFVIPHDRSPSTISRRHATLSPPKTEPVETNTPPPLAPLTIWGDEIAEIAEVQAKYRKLPRPEFPKRIDAGKVRFRSVSAAFPQRFRSVSAAFPLSGKQEYAWITDYGFISEV